MGILPSLNQYGDIALFVLRFALGMIFWVHGRSKLGMWNMMPSEQMSSKMISLMRFLSIAEPLGAIAVLSGLLTQLAAMGFCIVMLGAITMKIKRWKAPFMGTQTTGWELDFLVLCASLALIFLGSGSLSLDRVLLGI